MKKYLHYLNGNWPIFIMAAMFLTLPLATIPGMFEIVFAVLGLFTLAIAVLIVASLATSRRTKDDAAPTE